MATHDFDELDEDLEDMVSEEDSNEEVANFEDLDSISIVGGDDEDDDEVRLVKPPSENEALRMMKTFSSIYDTSTQLAATMNVVIGDARQIIALAKKSGIDVGKITASYEAGVLKINKQIGAAQKYFELNKHIAEDLSSMKNELRDEFDELNASLLRVQKEYSDDISASLKNLSLKLNDFSRDMDFSGFEKVVKAEIEKVIKSSAIDRVQAAFDSVDKSFFLLEESVVKLVGVDKKKGLLEELREEVFTLEKKLDKIRIRSSFLNLLSVFMLGVCLSGGFVWFVVASDYEKRLSVSLAEHTVLVNEAWMKKATSEK